MFIIIFSIFFSGCYSIEIYTNPTEKGYIEYVKSEKRIRKEKKQYKRKEIKRRRNVYRKQN